MKKIDSQATQLTPAAQNVLSAREKLSDASGGTIRLTLSTKDVVENNDLDSDVTQSLDENVILIEQRHRLKQRTVEAGSQIKQCLMRAADGAVLVALHDQNAGGPIVSVTGIG